MQCTFSCDANLQSEYTIHSTIEVIKGDADELSVEFCLHHHLVFHTCHDILTHSINSMQYFDD